MLGFVLPLASLVLGVFDLVRRAFTGFVLAVGLALLFRAFREDGWL